MKLKLFAVVLVLVFMGAGCATTSYFGVQNKAWKAPKEFDMTQASIAKAEKSEASQYCPDKLNAARELAREAVETYWSCQSEKGFRMLEEARKLAREVESCEPPPKPAPPPEPEPEPAPEPAPAKEPEPEPAKPVVLQNVYYAFESAVLRPAPKSTLDYNAAILLDNPAVTVEAAGHTCNMGSEKYNQGLSERRSKAAIEYLVSKGIRRDRMTLRGYGETRPAQPNDTLEGRRLNRRVEFIIQ